MKMKLYNGHAWDAHGRQYWWILKDWIVSTAKWCVGSGPPPGAIYYKANGKFKKVE